jgi:outer membrane protein TolC
MKKRAIGCCLLLVFVILPFRINAGEQPVPVSTSGSDSGEVLTLDQCLKLGHQNSRQLEVAAQNVAIANEGLKQAYGGFLPTLNYSLSSTNPPSTGSDPYNGALSVNVYLYNGGKLTTGLKLAQLKLDAALEDQRKAKQQLTYTIKSVYYKLWLAQQMLIVAQSSYDNMGQHYEHVKKANQFGLATKYELLRARIQWEKLKPPVMKAQHDIDTAKLNLVNCVGLHRNRPFRVEMDMAGVRLLKAGTYRLPVLLEEAYKNRPEMHQAETSVQMAGCNVNMALAGYKPTVTLSQKYSGGGPDLQPWAWDKSLNLSVNLNGALFDGFVTQGKVAAAKDSLKIAEVSQLSIRDQIEVEVALALQNFEEAIEATNFNQSNIDFAKESLRLTQNHYNAGMATTLDLVDAQLNLDTTLTGYYQGISSYLTALAQLDLVLGKDMDEKLLNGK